MVNQSGLPWQALGAFGSGYRAVRPHRAEGRKEARLPGGAAPLLHWPQPIACVVWTCPGLQSNSRPSFKRPLHVNRSDGTRVDRSTYSHGRCHNMGGRFDPISIGPTCIPPPSIPLALYRLAPDQERLPGCARPFSKRAAGPTLALSGIAGETVRGGAAISGRDACPGLSPARRRYRMRSGPRCPAVVGRASF